jgi:hypothetical protein
MPEYMPEQLRQTMEDWEAQQRAILEAEQALEAGDYQQRMRELEAQMARQQGYQQEAQATSGIEAIGLGLQRNVQNRMRGLQETGMMATRAVAPQLESLGLLRNIYGTNLPAEVVQEGLTNRLEAQRREQAASEEIFAALKEEHPYATGLASLLTFGAELALMPKGIKADKAHPWRTAGRRMTQEGLIGGLYGMSVPTLSDEQKMFAIAGGALTGSLTAGAFTGAGRLAQFTPETKEAIARFMRIEKLLDARL